MIDDTTPDFAGEGNHHMPPSAALFPGRRLRICYWNATAKVIDAERLSLEQHLSRLGDVQVDVIRTTDGPEALPCDLLVVAAQKVPAEEFSKWLMGFRRKVQLQGSIWTPVLILADVTFDVLSEMMPEAKKDNWYFDILAPAHMTSLPIRVANLLRIHDHLQELKRYALAVDDITTKVTMLESQMKALRAPDRRP